MSKRRQVVVLSGAGISAESGLNTFRDAGGLWEGHRVEDVATPQAFANNRALVLAFYNQRRAQLQQVQPNAAHLALVQLEQAFDVHIITQNVDDLHERAGSKNVLHLHGELKKLRSSVHEHYVIDWDQPQTLHHCDPWGNVMRPFIVWFGEDVPLIGQAQALMQEADLVLVVGTSLQVYPAAGLLQYAPAHAQIVYVDPHAKTLGSSVEIMAQSATVGVPKVVKQWLGVD